MANYLKYEATTSLAKPLPVMRRNLWKEIKQGRWGYYFSAPFYILFLAFSLYPLLFSFILSFTGWGGRGPLEFIGLENFKLILKDKVFWRSMQNGVILFFMYAPLQTFLALVLAVILNSWRVRGYQVFRTLIFMPYITNMVAAGYVFQLLLDEDTGLLNNILQIFFIPPVAWLDTVWGARISLCLLIIWAWLGYHMVIMHAGLQTIPHELSEAALIDGATPAQAFLYVTVPLMRPVVLFSLVLSTIGSFNLFTELVALFPSSFGSGPLNATVTPTLAIYNQAFVNFRFGYASAMAYVFFALIFVVTVLQFNFFGRQRE
ncbi:MAG: sugar ABC transporter permease [Anaerolineales bacterium]|nr:sugar ABC transporter permease [Anaerolineales bacterium]